ncbi:hypothetical protein ONZ45_g12488 [Pleurotus djamor]|nr:hypothetical protein ONZ45_g12488 [Pleurotus djamor]
MDRTGADGFLEDVQVQDLQPSTSRSKREDGGRDLNHFFFDAHEDGSKRRRTCKKCSKVLVADVTTLRRHLEAHHKGLYREWCLKTSFKSKLPRDIADAKKAAAASTSQQLLTSHLVANPETPIFYSETTFRESALIWLVQTNQPVQAFDHPAFQNMIKIASRATQGVKLPNRNLTRDGLINMFKARLTSLRDRLLSSAVKGKISSTCDGWQASNVDAYFAVTAHWIEEQHKGIWTLEMGLIGFVQINNAHSGLRLGQVLYKIIARIGIQHKMGHITCDNASNNSTMLKTFEELMEKDQFKFDSTTQHVRCLAHVNNLATQALLKTYSKSKHYDPTTPDTNLHISHDKEERDEVGLVRTISVKVIDAAKNAGSKIPPRPKVTPAATPPETLPSLPKAPPESQQSKETQAIEISSDSEDDPEILRAAPAHWEHRAGGGGGGSQRMLESFGWTKMSAVDKARKLKEDFAELRETTEERRQTEERNLQKKREMIKESNRVRQQRKRARDSANMPEGERVKKKQRGKVVDATKILMGSGGESSSSRLDVATLSHSATSHWKSERNGVKGGRVERPKYSRTCWFEPFLWEPIDQAAPRALWSPQGIVDIVQQYAPKTYKKLHRGTVTKWMNGAGWSAQTLARVNEEKVKTNTKKVGIFKKFPSLEESVRTQLTGLRRSGIAINIRLARTIMLALTLAKHPELLKTFKCSESFVRSYLHNVLQWSKRKGTRAAAHLPADAPDVCERAFFRIVNLMKEHDIPAKLVINADQLGKTLITGNNTTWAHTGDKQVDVAYKEEKRAFTLMVASTMAGEILPFQQVWQGKTRGSIPKAVAPGFDEAEQLGFQFTFAASEKKTSHFSTFKTMCEWVDGVLVPFIARTKASDPDLRDVPNQKSILFIDCYPVHTGTEFRTWLQKNHPNILLLFVPANCTGVFQPADKAWAKCVAKTWCLSEECTTSRKARAALRDYLRNDKTLRLEIEKKMGPSQQDTSERSSNDNEGEEEDDASDDEVSDDDTDIPTTTIIQQTLGIAVPDHQAPSKFCLAAADLSYNTSTGLYSTNKREEVVDTFVYELGRLEKDLTKRAKIDNLKLSSAEWKRVKLLLELLSLSDSAQQAFSSDQHSSLFLALPALEALHKAWSKRSELPEYASFRPALNAAVEKIEEYYNRTSDTDAYIITMFLHPESKGKHIRKQWGEKLYKQALACLELLYEEYYKRYSSDDSHTTTTHVPHSSHHGLGSLLQELSSDDEEPGDEHGFGPSDSLKPWLPSFNKYIKAHDHLSSMSVLNSERLPVWADIARDYLPIMASSVSSERAFSAAGMTITKHRNRLKADIVEALQFLKWDTSRRDFFTSGPTGIETDFAAQKEIDNEIANEIARHKERVRALKSQRNTYCAINKMPVEVVLRILLVFKHDLEEWYSRIEDSRRRWFTLMRVCQFWRNLVLGCPRFWNHIDVSSPHAGRMLTLAKGAPLKVILREPSSSNERFWTLAASIMARVVQIQDFTLELRSITDLSRVYSLSTNKKAPILETLTLSERSPNAIEGHDVSDIVWLDMPSLSSLFIRDIPSLPTAFISPCLTTLDMHSSRQISLSWVIGILQNTPLLEILDIDGLGPEPPDFTTSPVSLPNMQKLYLISECFGSSSIFKHLRLPVTAAFEARFGDTDDPEERVDISGVVSTFSRFTSNHSPSPLERISIVFLPSFGIYVYCPEDKYWLTDSDGGLPFFLVQSPRTTSIPITSYAPLCHALPLSSLHILALSGVKGDALISMAVSIMKASIHIKTLELEDFDIALLDRLFKLPGVDLPINFELECLMFKRPLYEEEEEQDLLPVVVRLLRERRRLGIPITMVKGWCLEDVPTRMMNNLKWLVHVVDCELD